MHSRAWANSYHLPVDITDKPHLFEARLLFYISLHCSHILWMEIMHSITVSQMQATSASNLFRHWL